MDAGTYVQKKAGLDGLTIARFFAAICVVIYHFYDRSQAPSPLLANLFSGGFFPFFFILSGFLLTYVARPNQTLRDFWVKRLARVYPVYVLAWIGTGLFLFLWMPTLTAFLRTLGFYGLPTLIFAQSWIPKAAVGWNWPAWSMAAEIFFWLTFPWAYRLIARSRRLVVLLAVFVIVNAFIYVARAELTAARALMLEGTLLETPWSRYIAYFPPTFLVQFLMGIALAFLFMRHGSMPRIWRCVAIAATGFVLVLPAKIAGVASDAYLGLCYCALIYAIASMRVPASALTGMLVTLGKTSYSLFILQGPVWTLYWYCQGENGGHRPFSQLLPYLALLIVIALLTYRYIETPASDWIRKRFGAPRPAALPLKATATSPGLS
ncbi:acyltransferase [Povalibacter sp.]|uniref:acyltransferase family protein n=1 Tax=Povalibacter sp. TaxID=1962978 RepID=UPI002F416EFB